MPKRKSPFDELPILSKMHIGVKEINLFSANSEENMRKVYDKTHSLLFNGSANGNLSSNGKTTKNFMQYISCKKSKPAVEKEMSNEIKVCCASQRNAPCTFCDKTICCSCCRICSLCNMEFCQLCSILQYNTHEETAVCLSCL